MANKITARLQTPEDAEGNRTDIHLITTADEVIVNPDTEYSETLSTALKNIESNTIIISDNVPEVNKTALWIKPVE